MITVSCLSRFPIIPLLSPILLGAAVLGSVMYCWPIPPAEHGRAEPTGLVVGEANGETETAAATTEGAVVIELASWSAIELGDRHP